MVLKKFFIFSLAKINDLQSIVAAKMNTASVCSFIGPILKIDDRFSLFQLFFGELPLILFRFFRSETFQAVFHSFPS